MIRLVASGQRDKPGQIRIKGRDGTSDSETETDQRDRRRSKVLLIDPVTTTRESLTHMLANCAADIRVEAASNAAQLPDIAPDFVLLNIHGANPDEAKVRATIARARQSFGGSVPIALIADLSDWPVAMGAIMDYSLQGYIPTSVSPSVAVAAILLMLAGGTFAPLGRDASHLPAARSLGPPARVDTKTEEAHGLTARESEVFGLLRLGKPNKIIAFDLSISESTVKVHVRNIMKKLNATNRTQVAVLLSQDAISSVGEMQPV